MSYRREKNPYCIKLIQYFEDFIKEEIYHQTIYLGNRKSDIAPPSLLSKFTKNIISVIILPSCNPVTENSSDTTPTFTSLLPQNVNLTTQAGRVKVEGFYI